MSRRKQATVQVNTPTPERRVQAFVMDSATMQIARVDSPAFLDARQAAATWQQTLKAVTDAPSSGSSQVAETIGVSIDGVSCARRPFDFAVFAYAGVVNTYHASAITAKVKDICGRPWRIDGDGSEANRRTLERFFRHAFGKRGFAGGMGCVWTDYESLGNGYLEVIPTQKGDAIAEFSHVPAPEVWVRLDGLGYVQQRNGRYSHFKDFLAAPERIEALDGNDPLKRSAKTSIIHFSRYHPWSPHYGIPCVMPAWNAITLMVLASEHNLSYFNNNCIPDYAITLEGETAEDAVKTIKTYFERHLKGQAHKTLVMETPSGSKIHFEKLTSDNAKEGNFRLLRIDCRDEVLQAHGVPPIKVGIVEAGKLGGNLATEQMKEYKLSIVEPGRELVTMALYEVVARGFGIEDLWLEFEEFDVDDREADSRIDQVYLDRAVITPNEVRRFRYPDLPPLEGGDVPLSAPSPEGDPALIAAVTEMQADVRKAVQR